MTPARLALLAAAALAILACDAADRQTSGAASTGPPVDEEERVLYAVGQGLASQFALKGLFTEAELAYAPPYGTPCGTPCGTA